MKHIPWPSIGQFRDVVKNVSHRAAYVGMDDNGDPIYNKLSPKPTLKFEGTVKLHGTNFAVGVSPNFKDYWFQSRENIITPQKDNAGSAMFGEAHKNIFISIAEEVACLFHPSAMIDEDILIFGEWCGGSIQKGVALNQLPKMFVIFGIALVDEESQKTYLTRTQVEDVCNKVEIGHEWQRGLDARIFSIYNFPTFEIDIDFENPHESVNTLNSITEKIGDECPVGKALGATAENGSTTGEGIVWRCVTSGYEDSGYFFKVKDERHSNSKVKTLATVDVEKINNIKTLAETIAHEGRLQQQYDLVFDTLNGGEPDIKRMGEFIKFVMQDCFKEDIDVIAASGFTGKELNGPVSKIVRDFLFQKLEV